MIISICPEDLCDLPIITSNQTMVNNEFSGWLGMEYIVWKKYQLFSKAADRFLKEVQEAFHQGQDQHQ